MFLKQKKYHSIFTLLYQYLRYLFNWSCCTLKNFDISHTRFLNETLFSEKHISIMTECGYEAKSHKLPQGNSLVLTLSQATNFRLYQIERVCRRQFQI